MTVSLQRNADGSLTLPADVLGALALGDGSSVDLTLDGEQLIIHANGQLPHLARRRPKYTMEELLADYDQIPKNPEEDYEWLNSPPVGRELI